MEVEVIRSAKRRKSVSARIVDGRIVVRMPQWMTKAQEAEYVESMVAKLVRQHTATTVDLTARAAELARRYDLPSRRSIRFVSNQASRWGSCSPSTGEIRISDRIAGVPGLGARRGDRARARPPRGGRTTAPRSTRWPIATRSRSGPTASCSPCSSPTTRSSSDLRRLSARARRTPRTRPGRSARALAPTANSSPSISPTHREVRLGSRRTPRRGSHAASRQVRSSHDRSRRLGATPASGFKARAASSTELDPRCTLSNLSSIR